MARPEANKYCDITFNLEDTYEARHVVQDSYIHLNEATKTVSCIAFIPTGNVLAAGSLDSTVRVYKINSRNPFLVFKGHRYSVRGVVHLHENVVASIDDYGNILTWDSQRGQAIDSHNIFGRPLNNVLWEPSIVDGKQGVYSMEKVTDNTLVVGTIKKYPVYVGHDRSGSNLRRFYDTIGYTQTKLITDTATYGNKLVTASSDNSLVIRLIRHRNILCKIELDASVLCTAINARYIVAGCNNGNLYVFKNSTYELECIFKEPEDLLLTISFIDNDVLMTGGTSGTVNFVSLKGKCYLSRVLVQKGKYIYSALLLPNFKIAVGGGKGNSIPFAAVLSAPPEIESMLCDLNLPSSSASSDISNEIRKVKVFLNDFGYDITSKLLQLNDNRQIFNSTDFLEEQERAKKLLDRTKSEEGFEALVGELQKAVDPLDQMKNEVSRLNNEIEELSREFESSLRKLRTAMDTLEQSLDDPVCVFCLETILPGDVVIRLPCMHLFHRDCALPYFRQQYQPCCPIDRKSVRREEIDNLPIWIYGECETVTESVERIEPQAASSNTEIASSDEEMTRNRLIMLARLLNQHS